MLQCNIFSQVPREKPGSLLDVSMLWQMKPARRENARRTGRNSRKRFWQSRSTFCMKCKLAANSCGLLPFNGQTCRLPGTHGNVFWSPETFGKNRLADCWESVYDFCPRWQRFKMRGRNNLEKFRGTSKLQFR
ncbi:uncharacterized protein LOC143216998 [Lasioglossum baleicum]|uniref:uncharacterized protein LOC143216998 n=1 Tax=Lasioglossum baleicum TaxID=434251 RepID=UPI003FCE6FDF